MLLPPTHDELLRMPWAKHSAAHSLVHPLVCHLIDTMEVARLLYHRFLGPQVRKELDEVFRPLSGGDPEQTVKWVALLCGLHDLGKFSPAFQSLVVDVAKARFPPSEHALLDKCAPARQLANLDTKHGLTTGVHLNMMLRDAGLPGSESIVVSEVLAAHHGYFPLSGELGELGRRRGNRLEEDIGNGIWENGRSATVRELARLAGVNFEDRAWSEVRTSTRSMVGLAGLTTISDWVASDTSFFPYADVPESLDEYRAQAAANAAAALESTGWWPWEPGEHTGYADIFNETPLPLQRVVEEAVQECTEAGVLVIEGPTGEGKTKAGLQAAARLAHRLGLGGLYYSTPTKELSRQATDDVRALLDGTGSELSVNLVFSGARQEHKEREEDERNEARPRIAPDNVCTESDAGEDGGTFSPVEWFFRKKGLAFPVGVGTVDQALKSVIRGGHNFLGLATLSNKVVVIDEVHAYDAYTMRIVEQLMWSCGSLGSPVVVMSATLTADQRAGLIEHWHAGAAQRVPDPEAASGNGPSSWNVTWSRDTTGARPVELSDVAKERGPLQVDHVDEDPGAIADKVEALVGSGGTALVVLNTRRRAHAVHDVLAARFGKASGSPALIHFDGDHQGNERREIRDRIEAHLGKGSPDERHAVVVGSPVLEGGFDLDADALITDLCPIDLLFQRAGRLHRHTRKGRPSHLVTPTLYVADVDPEWRAALSESKRTSLKFAPGIGKVYYPWVLGRTRVLLKEVLRRGDWNPMDEVGKQIHVVYGSEPLVEEGWETAWDNAKRSHDQQVEKAEADARQVLVPLLRKASGINRLTRRRAPAGSTRKSKGKERDTPARGR